MFTHFNIIWFPKRLKPLLEIILNKISTHITQLLAEIYLVVFVQFPEDNNLNSQKFGANTTKTWFGPGRSSDRWLNRSDR